MNVLQAGKIYSTNHPKFKEFLERLYLILEDILQQRKEITLGIVSGELAWEEEIFFDLSKKLGALITFLEENRIERIIFAQGLRYEELHQFIVFLTTAKKKEKAEEKEFFAPQGIQHVRAGRLRAHVPSDGPDQEYDELRRKYVSSVQAASRVLNIVLEEEEIDYLDLRFNILSVMEDFMGRHQELLNLVSVKQKDLVTFVHLLNVALLVMFFASKLGFSKDDVLDLGIAALYHDIGKLYIFQRIIKKKSKLTEREYLQGKDHPIIGATILDSYRDSLGYLPVVAAYEHHLRYDLTGYPKMSFPRQPHFASLMISICDVYDALALKRSYKKDYPPDKIYELMILEKGKIFHPELLDKFFRFIGVWPVGTIIALNDERIAIVRQVSEEDIFRPMVEIVAPENHGQLVDLRKEPHLRIEEALNPHGKGNDYLHLVGPRSPFI